MGIKLSHIGQCAALEKKERGEKLRPAMTTKDSLVGFYLMREKCHNDKIRSIDKACLQNGWTPKGDSAKLEYRVGRVSRSRGIQRDVHV